jgi:hypothetical protein
MLRTGRLLQERSSSSAAMDHAITICQPWSSICACTAGPLLPDGSAAQQSALMISSFHSVLFLSRSAYREIRLCPGRPSESRVVRTMSDHSTVRSVQRYFVHDA